MKKLLLLLSLLLIFSPCSYSQWWVSGGNLIWPYGNVSIAKGSLGVDSVVSKNGNLTLKDLSGSSSIGLSSTHINLSTDSTQFSGGDLYFNNSNNIWLNYDSNPFHIYNYDGNPVFTYDYNAGKFILNPYANGSLILLDDGNVTIKLQSYISQINSGLVYIGDYTNGNNGTEIDLDDEGRTIILDADTLTITTHLSDSTGLSPGQLYFDSNGFLKRKF